MSVDPCALYILFLLRCGSADVGQPVVEDRVASPPRTMEAGAPMRAMLQDRGEPTGRKPEQR